jgi:hypothetical protein
MTGFTVAAAASIFAGLSIGAAATVGVTLAIQEHSARPAVPAPSGPYSVAYGDRCYHGHCAPCSSPQDCLNKLPPWLRP